MASTLKSVSAALTGSYFRGRTALITGASSGIGRDLALTLARMGAKVALVARRQELLEELAREIAAKGGTALVHPADLVRAEAAREAVARTLEEFGHLDILVNSAGIIEPAPVETLDAASLQRMMDVNLFATLYTTQAVIPAMRRAGTGSIINIASLAGRRGLPPLAGYCATKFAVVGLTEALRVELHGTGVKASLVMPGVVNTPMTASGNIEALAGISDKFYAMPVQWVTWAIIAAIAFRLAEVDVPPGAVFAEKLAALVPTVSDGALAIGLRLLARLGRGS